MNTTTTRRKYMFNQPTEIANTVSRWTGMGVTLPLELSTAIAVYEAIRYTEIGYEPTFSIEGVTPENAEEKIYALADLLATRVSNGGWTPLEEAKRTASTQAASRVNSLASQAVPAIIEQLAPDFEAHAVAYIAAAAKLPEDVSADTLLDAGPDAVTAYGEAKREAVHLNNVSSWVATTGYLSGAVRVETVVRILRPSSAFELFKLDEAAGRSADPALVGIDPVLYSAARLGVEFGINTLQESNDIRSRLETAAAGSVRFA